MSASHRTMHLLKNTRYLVFSGRGYSPIIVKSAFNMIIHYSTLPVLAFFAILLAIQTTRKRRSHTIDHLIYVE